METDTHGNGNGLNDLYILPESNEEESKIIEYLEKNLISKVYPSHCTSLPALVEFYKAFRIIQVLSGNYYIFS